MKEREHDVFLQLSFLMRPKDVLHVALSATHHSAAYRGSLLPGLGSAQRTPPAPQRAKKRKHSSAQGASCAPTPPPISAEQKLSPTVISTCIPITS